MRQIEIQFFWPLTEQIPLDLDYTDCGLKITASSFSNSSFLFTGEGSSNITLNAPVLTLDENSVRFGLKKIPPWYRRILFKLLGLKWELK